MRTYTDAEKAAFARHEGEQRRREAGLTWTQKLEWLHEANELAVALLRHHPRRHLVDEGTLHPLPRG